MQHIANVFRERNHIHAVPCRLILLMGEIKEMTGDNMVKFWINAFLKGGGAGLYGDFLFSDHTRYSAGVNAWPGSWSG
ncbi:hypothetical protein ACR0Q7_09875 [Enterococcus faecalis]